MSDNSFSITIQGTTGSGKSALAYLLAKKLGGEIISADSRQVYTHCDIGTNKEYYSDIPTHVMSIIDPSMEYSAGQFIHDATQSIEAIHKRGNIPIIVGGTNFYIDVLTGKQLLYDESPYFADYLKKRKDELGNILITDLQHYLPTEYVETLSPSEKANRHRLISKIAHREFYDGNLPPLLSHPAIGTILPLGIDIPFALLTQRITTRTNTMIARGLEDEARYLYAHYSPTIPLLNSIGYAEWGHAESSTPQDIAALISLHTRQYAKRQRTWTMRDTSILWIHGWEAEEKRDDLSNKVISEVIKKKMLT